MAVGVRDGVGVGVGDPVGEGVGVALRDGEGVAVGLFVGVPVGDWLGVGVDVGVCDGVALGVADGDGPVRRHTPIRAWSARYTTDPTWYSTLAATGVPSASQIGKSEPGTPMHCTTPRYGLAEGHSHSGAHCEDRHERPLIRMRRLMLTLRA